MFLRFTIPYRFTDTLHSSALKLYKWNTSFLFKLKQYSSYIEVFLHKFYYSFLWLDFRSLIISFKTTLTDNFFRIKRVGTPRYNPCFIFL